MDDFFSLRFIQEEQGASCKLFTSVWTSAHEQELSKYTLEKQCKDLNRSDLIFQTEE